MRVDWYTKAVLTVIAIALSAIAIQNATGTAVAQGGGRVPKMAICSEDGARCADVDAFGADFRKNRLRVSGITEQ